MLLQCTECGTSFTWTRPSGRHGSNPPKICGKAGKDGLWIPTPACRQSRQSKSYLAWKAANPEKCKANQGKQYKKRKANQDLPDYEFKNIPKPKVKNRCTWPGCRNYTANNGVNRLWCQRHWDIMTNDIACDEFIFINGGDSEGEQFQENAR